MTYTYAVLEVSPAAHAEIKAKLLAAGYQHAIKGDTIDMHGIALEPEPCPLNQDHVASLERLNRLKLIKSDRNDDLPAGVQPFDPREPWSTKSIP